MKAMLKKEFKEIFRTYRWLLLPCVFLFLSIAQPISFHLMPNILEHSNLPPGTVLEIPKPAPGDVVTSIIAQFNQMGILMIILMAMGTVAGERKSGVATAVLVKPVSILAYLLSKFIAYTVLTFASFAVGLGAGVYYTQLLIGPISFEKVFWGSLVYFPYLMVIVAITIFASALFSSQGAAGGIAFIISLALLLLPKLHEWTNKTFPGALTETAQKIMAGATEISVAPLISSTVIMILALGAGWYSLKHQEL